MSWIIAQIILILKKPIMSGAIFFIVFYLILWIYSFSSGKTREEKIKDFQLNRNILILLTGAYAFLMSFFSSTIAASLIYAQGTETVGRVVSQESTSINYNDSNVKRRHVVYLLENNELMKSSFLTMPSSMHPQAKYAYYPMVNEEFRLRYVKEYPQYFVIVPDLVLAKCREIEQEISRINFKIFVNQSKKKKKDEKNEKDNQQLHGQLTILEKAYNAIDCKTKLSR